MMNPLIPKWVIGSIAKRFKTLTNSLNIPLYVETIDSPTDEDYQNTNLSLRVDGPTVIESSNWTTYRVSVQGLVTAVGDRTAYTLHDHAGRVAEVLRGVIPVYDTIGEDTVSLPYAPVYYATYALEYYGSGGAIVSDGLVGCLDIDPRTVESVRVVNLGRVSSSSNVRQISVVADLILDIN